MKFGHWATNSADSAEWWGFWGFYVHNSWCWSLFVRWTKISRQRVTMWTNNVIHWWFTGVFCWFVGGLQQCDIFLQRPQRFKNPTKNQRPPYIKKLKSICAHVIWAKKRSENVQLQWIRQRHQRSHKLARPSDPESRWWLAFRVNCGSSVGILLRDVVRTRRIAYGGIFCLIGSWKG
jgi:hypothetical protein